MTAKDSTKLEWTLASALLCLVALLLSSYALVREANQALLKYKDCTYEHAKYLPMRDARICCMSGGLHHTIQHPEDQVITFSDETLIVMSTAQGGKALLVFLFLTPILLLSFGVLMSNQFILRVGAMSMLVAYLVIASAFIYAIATFTDS
jgi:hypothetical protein